MGLYFFIIHVLKKYRRTRAVNREYKLKKIAQTNELFIANQLLTEILKESYSQRAINNQLLYNELLYIAKKLIQDAKYGVLMDHHNLYYLNLVSESYFLENDPVILLQRLLVRQDINYKFISRIVNYPEFREWVTVLVNNSILLDHQYIYNTFVLHLYIYCIIP
jgi:hypothetical protein